MTNGILISLLEGFKRMGKKKNEEKKKAAVPVEEIEAKDLMQSPKIRLSAPIQSSS